MSTQHAQRSVFSVRCNAFTLVELLVSMLIISILAGLVMFAMNSAMESVKITRTRTTIAKIDRVIGELWSEYQYRRIPIVIPPGTDPLSTDSARLRLEAVRELMRLELPEHASDIREPTVDFNGDLVPNDLDLPMLARAYGRLCEEKGFPTQDECLGLILKMVSDEDGSAIDRFTSQEIGDLDHDGWPEILDAWGRPIVFIRWAPGFSETPGDDGAWGAKDIDDDMNGVVDDFSEAGWPGSDDQQSMSDIQLSDPLKHHDPFDPRGLDPAAFALYPLIISGGPDGKLGLFYSSATGIPIHGPCDKIDTSSGPMLIAEILDKDNPEETVDNIHNHTLSTRLNQ